ncbi:transcriptional regulator, partial [Proteus mirabilis]
RSTVPATNNTKFELKGKNSLRQLLLLWQFDDLNNLYAVVDPKKANKPRIPRTIEEVLQDEF